MSRPQEFGKCILGYGVAAQGTIDETRVDLERVPPGSGRILISFAVVAAQRCTGAPYCWWSRRNAGGVG
jgi:hypothetical protein